MAMVYEPDHVIAFSDHDHVRIFPRFKGDKYGWIISEIGVQSLGKLQVSIADL